MPSALGPAVVSARQVSLCSFALAAVASELFSDGRIEASSPEIQFLQHHLEAIRLDDAAWNDSFHSYLDDPAPIDLPFFKLAQVLELNDVELLTIALVLAVETNVMAGRAIALVQAPVGGSRPTLGLLSSSLASLTGSAADSMNAILTGAANKSGLITLLNEGAPLAERALSIPVPICLALNGHDSDWPAVQIGMGPLPDIPLSTSILKQAKAEAASLKSDVLVLRTASVSEGRSVACAIAKALNRRAAYIRDAAMAPGFAPWLLMNGLIPVFSFDLSPGEKKSIPSLPYYRGPALALCGPDGIVEFRDETPRSWVLPVPSVQERRRLWQNALGPSSLADEAANHHRHGCGRIAHLGRLAHRQALLRGSVTPEHRDLAEASWTGEGAGLEAYAQPLRDRITDDALVMPPLLRQELDQLFLRCRSRDGLVDGLGASTVARYRPGVRALFLGPSGTGKTLAAGWLATRLGLPLYRVDLASITSKYIGETEKNLAQMLARAEHAEVVLLFDEADSLFAKRTEVREANDRFANAQTNYLLQRIETFDGITILTSNSRARFDNAFARRLDLIVEFPIPGPEQRRALWQSHLGTKHSLTQRELNQVAALADLCGGNIRNAVLAAAVPALTESRNINYADVVEALAAEYRKLGRQMPVELMS